MRLTQLESLTLRLPLTRPVSPASGDGRFDHLHLVVVHLDTDAGHRGLGFVPTFRGSRAIRSLIDDDLAPALRDKDPLDHERLHGEMLRVLADLGQGSVGGLAAAALDIALWDLKGKAAGLPLAKLLGGARDAVRCYAGDAGWLWMSPDDILAAARSVLAQNMMGLQVQVGHPDPENDAQRLNRLHQELGDDLWLGVDASGRLDLDTAFRMGQFLPEEIGADWLAEPTASDDLAGLARLARRLDLPLALGARCNRLADFQALLDADAVGVARIDFCRLGGITTWLKAATLAEARRVPLVPLGPPEVGVHLACGLRGVTALEHVGWLTPAFVSPPALVDGRLVPPARPGLGIDLDADAVEKYRIGD
jgi:L-alanine-DL-glutamate epimerase-like enolase superfamily enzyme